MGHGSCFCEVPRLFLASHSETYCPHVADLRFDFQGSALMMHAPMYLSMRWVREIRISGSCGIKNQGSAKSSKTMLWQRGFLLEGTTVKWLHSGLEMYAFHDATTRLREAERNAGQESFLEDADVVFPPQVGYIVDRTRFGRNYICLGMSSGNIYGLTIDGALHTAGRQTFHIRNTNYILVKIVLVVLSLSEFQQLSELGITWTSQIKEISWQIEGNSWDIIINPEAFVVEDHGKMRGITLPLIHPESPQSLVFKSNQTHEQRIQGLINRSHARVAGYFPTNTSSVAQTRPPYPSFKSYYLYMDTGSDLTWIQCEGCRAPGGRCLNQKEPVYPNSLSGSYYPLPCKKHKLCAPNQCINASCSYNVRYLDNTSSSGILASENYVFNSTFGKMEVLKDLVYGCGIDNRKNYGNNSNQIAGMMGLGWGSYSILSQANSLTEGRFSYCLPAISKYTQKWPNTYLRFGNDARQAVNSKKLNVSDRDFRLRGDGSGGCIIDSILQTHKTGLCRIGKGIEEDLM
ncbi:Aspartic proteinase Asp1 [Sesamum angolense]|uniref:Aspartic proteinase Asp1 n=1 Tax=Sesamum angolense TaxID=2727404 RepID=A0AAE1X8B1_9LAMI|nr:Aspartic proteinase Asp1 [Sesamum angolense]